MTGCVFPGKPPSLLMLQVITQNNNNLGSTAEHFKQSGAFQGRVMRRWQPGHPTPQKAMELGEVISGSGLILMELAVPQSQMVSPWLSAHHMNQLNQPWGLEKRNLNYSMPQQSCQTSLRPFGNDTKKSKKKSLKTLKPPQKFRCVGPRTLQMQKWAQQTSLMMMMMGIG